MVPMWLSHVMSPYCDSVTLSYMILSHAPSLCSKSRKEKKRKEKINNDLAVLPSHDKNGLLLYRRKVYIPHSVEDTLWQQIIKIHHDLPSARHPGWWKTYELVSRNYWWPGMTTFVKKYVTGCDIYQQMKNCTQQPFGPLVPNKVPNRPWKIISMDLIMQLPESNGYNAICVIVNRLTKRAYFIPINNRFSSKDMAQLLYDKVYPLYGLLLQIILNRGVQYSAKLFQ